MGYRKFYYGDTVTVAGGRYPSHEGHKGRIVGTHITPRQLYYRLACECGKQLSPSANQMDLVATPHEDPDYLTVQEIRMDYFLRQVGVEPQRDTMNQQIEKSLATIRKVRDRKVMTQRFGLDGSEGKSLQEIGDEYGLTRQRVYQIEARLLGLIRHELEKEKHEDRIETPA